MLTLQVPSIIHLTSSTVQNAYGIDVSITMLTGELNTISYTVYNLFNNDELTILPNSNGFISGSGFGGIPEWNSVGFGRKTFSGIVNGEISIPTVSLATVNRNRNVLPSDIKIVIVSHAYEFGSSDEYSLASMKNVDSFAYTVQQPSNRSNGSICNKPFDVCIILNRWEW
jgi:hypothetical protein